ncbi:AAA family ATPase [Lachnospiraceae bacterium NSJ-143]|nr:AAA family ATPase [Lachnospiraceae bacterium NSJ-143]
MSINELKYCELNSKCPLEELNFKTTDELEPIDGIIGQKKAERAMELGLRIKASGYNIYMCGSSGLGKTTYAKMCAQKAAENEPRPKDYCYVYNFDEPKCPRAISFEAGKGRQFRDDMNELTEFFNSELSKVFSSDEYDEQKNEIIRSYDDRRNKLMRRMSHLASEYGFTVKSSSSGVFFMPVIDGEEISEEKYEELDDEEKERINTATGELTMKASSVLREIHECEKDCRQEVSDLDYKTGMFAVGYNINMLQEKYGDSEEVIKYIADVQEDLLDNISKFIPSYVDDEDGAAGLLPLLGKKNPDDTVSKYKVNLIVDNSKNMGAPVVVDYSPTGATLAGEMEYDNEFGNLITDFMKIKPGLFHKANGGYLILQARDVISNYQAWEAIRRVMRTGKIKIDGLRDQFQTVPVPTLNPEPIDASFKIILVGSSYYFEVLSEYEEDFEKYFKILADFDYEMERSPENVFNTARFIKSYSIKEKLMPFNAKAVAEVIECASRMADKNSKLSTRFNKICEILCEADAWAKIDGAEVVTDKYVKQARDERKKRLMLYEEKIFEMIDSGVIMLDTKGRRVGQINGLSVIDMGGYSFGNVSRITAVSYMGKSGIINIEKEAEMSGSTHTKGMNIIAGYMGGKYAQDFPISLSCRVCFEQNYGGIDGDSASSTELYCILSSLSGIPVNQQIAVTGSVNQFGDIQAIGGVNEKIEAFYDLCERRGFTGSQGVMIPETNAGDLMLKDEVVEAVREGKFHIYTVSSIDDGIELMLEFPAGSPDKDGKYPKDSVHGRVYEKLKEYYIKSFEEPDTDGPAENEKEEIKTREK